MGRADPLAIAQHIHAKQVLIEVHFFDTRPGMTTAIINNFFIAMHNDDFVIFHKEPNIEYGGGDSVEFAFLKTPPGFVTKIPDEYRFPV